MIFHVYANQSNAGDWLAARGIQSLLQPHAVRDLFCDTPFVADTMRELAQAGPEDFVIIGGGGLLMDYFRPFWEKFLTAAVEVPFGLWGIGLCDHKHAPSQLPPALLRRIVQTSKLCFMRDELTRAALSEFHLPEPAPCPALVAVAPRTGARGQLLHVDHFELLGPSNYQRIVRAAQEFAQRTGRVYRQCNNRIGKGQWFAVESILNLYASADIVLSSRLHGCVIALAIGRPVLAISGDRKIESFMRAAGLGDWVLDLAQLDSLPDRLASLSSQRVPHDFVQRARERNVCIAQKFLEAIESHAKQAKAA
jgi:hypothetical protein